MNPSQLTAENLEGYDPTGAQTRGRTINGTEEWDVLTGTVGNDVMYANGGGGSLAGSGGADKLYGGSEGDNLVGDVGHDRLEGAGGDDSLTGGYGNDTLLGGEGNDYLWGSDGNDVLEGGDGDDLLSGGTGTDRLIGGEGNDTISVYDRGSATMDGGNGDDIFDLQSYLQSSSMFGGAGNDRFILSGGTIGTFLLDAGAGSDRIEFAGGFGAKSVKTGSGVDTLAFTSSLNFQLNSGIVRDFAVGLSGDRVEWGSSLAADLVGWHGTTNPFLSGYFRVVQNGTSTLLQVDFDGHDVNQTFATLLEFANVNAADLMAENLGGYSPVPVLRGNSKANRIVGKSAAEQIDGQGGNDQLLGAGGVDLILGGSGNDVIDGGTGADRLYGGAGDDSYAVDNFGDWVFELAGEGTDLVQSLVSFSLNDHVDNLTLIGAGAINGEGNGAANILSGNPAANRLRGMGGNDVLNGAGGADRLEGGKGNDTYIIDSADLVIELSGQGTDTISSSAGYTLGDHFENLTLTGAAEIDGTGNALANVLTGNDARNRLDGGLGADTMTGGKGNDFYFVDTYGDRVIEAAGGGNDAIYSSVSMTLPSQVEKLILTGTKTLEGRGNAASNTIVGTSNGNVLKGNDGHDRMDGGGSHDRLYGGTGNDILTGGVGNDGFYFDTKLASNNVDSILDFLPAKDTIHLSAKIFRGIAGGTLPANAFHQGSAAADAADRIVYEAASGRIFYDADGTGAAAQILFATVTPGTALTHADFVI